MSGTSDSMHPRSGKAFRSDGSIVNEADGLNDDGSRNIRIKGGVNVSDYGPITPNDSIDLTKLAIGLCVTGAVGTVTVVKPNDLEVTIPATMLPLGQIQPLPAKRIKATGTTATGIWVIYG